MEVTKPRLEMIPVVLVVTKRLLRVTSTSWVKGKRDEENELIKKFVVWKVTRVLDGGSV